MDTTKKTKKSWNDQDTNIVIWHSKGIKAKAACAVLEKILLDRTKDAILSKVYEVQAIERENALKAYRNSESRMQVANEIVSKEVSCATDSYQVKELNVAEVAIKKRIESFQNNVVEPIKVFPASVVIEEEIDEDVMSIVNNRVTILSGGIKIPFAGTITSDFEIEGTFTIRKLKKPMLL